MEITKIDIAWADPGFTHGEFAHNIAKQASDMEYFGCLGEIHRTDPSILAAGRNQLVDSFLKDSDSEWLWMVDSDMLFDKGHPMKLWECADEHDVKIVSGLAFIFQREPGRPIPSYFVKGKPPFYSEDDLLLTQMVPDRPTEVAATGLASVLINREVFEGLEAPRHPDYRWFDQIIMPNGHMSGEDVQFFTRAAEIGYQTVLEPRARTAHLKTVGIGYDEFERYMAEVDAT